MMFLVLIQVLGIGIFAFASENTTCRSTCFPNTSYSSSACNVTSGQCLFGCVHGYAGPFCSVECPENCAPSSRSANQICYATSRECFFGCTDGFYGLNCNEKCSDVDSNCKKCVANADDVRGMLCTECRSDFYREKGKCLYCSYWCSRIPSSPLPTCRESDGYCNHGCKDGRYSFNCGKRCSSTCKDTCDRDTGTCIGGCRFPSYCGPTCQIPCQDGCVSQLCNQSCRCAKGCNTNYWGPKCQNLCNENCNRHVDSDIAICNNNDGTCNKGCHEDKFWGRYCSKACPVGCTHGTCQQNTGMCKEGCICKKLYGKRCDKACGEACPDGTCEQFSGHCVKENE